MPTPTSPTLEKPLQGFMGGSEYFNQQTGKYDFPNGVDYQSVLKERIPTLTDTEKRVVGADIAKLKTPQERDAYARSLAIQLMHAQDQVTPGSATPYLPTGPATPTAGANPEFNQDFLNKAYDLGLVKDDQYYQLSQQHGFSPFATGKGRLALDYLAPTQRNPQGGALTAAPGTAPKKKTKQKTNLFNPGKLIGPAYGPLTPTPVAPGQTYTAPSTSNQVDPNEIIVTPEGEHKTLSAYQAELGAIGLGLGIGEVKTYLDKQKQLNLAKEQIARGQSILARGGTKGQLGAGKGYITGGERLAAKVATAPGFTSKVLGTLFRGGTKALGAIASAAYDIPLGVDLAYNSLRRTADIPSKGFIGAMKGPNYSIFGLNE